MPSINILDKVIVHWEDRAGRTWLSEYIVIPNFDRIEGVRELGLLELTDRHSLDPWPVLPIPELNSDNFSFAKKIEVVGNLRQEDNE